MPLISSDRINQVGYTSSSNRSNGSFAGVLYFNFTNIVGYLDGIQKVTGSRAVFNYSGYYEINFFAWVRVTASNTVFIEYGLNDIFVSIDDITPIGTNIFFSYYSFIIGANAGDYIELRARCPSNALFEANMMSGDSNSILSTTMSIKRI
jgi:hypothetical protein